MASTPNNSTENPDGLVIHLDRFQKVGMILFVLGIVFSAIGYFVSPLDSNGKPILLSPEINQMESYQRSTIRWVEKYQDLDREISTIIANPQADLFSQSHDAQSALQAAVSLAQEIDRAAYPPSAVSLHEVMASTSLSYLDAARAMMVWVGAPNETNRNSMDEKLVLARQSLDALEKSTWLENR